MEIDTAVRRMLLQQPSVIGYVGTKVFKNALIDNVDGTGGRAVVVRRRGGWYPPDLVGTAEMPVVEVECWADPDREGGLKTVDNAIDKAYALQRVVSTVMNRQRDVWWGAGGDNPGVRVISCLQSDDPVHETATDLHGTGAGIGDCAIVTVHFDVRIAP